MNRFAWAWMASAVVLAMVPASEAGPEHGTAISPAFKINHPPHRAERLFKLNVDPSYRSIDGSGNNLLHPDMGAVHTRLQRWMHADYADGMAEMPGSQRPGPREISNAVNAQPRLIPNRGRASDFLWQWGQFLDHDLSLSDGTDPPEPHPIPIPGDDAHFPPGSAIPFNRSIYDKTTGRHDPDSGLPVAREPLNELTAWIDASQVYGSTPDRALALRTLDGTGRLKTSAGDLLPFNELGLPNGGGPGAHLFLAGDVRVNEQVGLIAMHTLFVREHNRLAAGVARRHPWMTDDAIYEKARRLVGAQMQVITYNEFLPALLGPGALSPYRGYKPQVNAQIANEFSAAAFRLGHSALSPVLLRLDADGAEVPWGHLRLRDAFFAPRRIVDEGGIDPILRGLAAQICQEIDAFVIDDVRNFLFGPPGAGGFDLPALNIQRGRDHGLPSYNDLREAFGLGRAASFADISSSPEIQERLASVYDHVDDVDLWVGGLAEDPFRRALVGRLFFKIMKKQFEALRDGDRFWYQRALSPGEIRWVEGTRLADIIWRNTSIGRELQGNVFRVPRSPRPAVKAGLTPLP